MSDWYKMNPLDWNSGTDELSLEQEAAYLRLCNAMYITDGPIRENSFVLCGLFRCNDRKANRLLSDLVNAGKIIVENGLISNRRVLEVVSDRARLRIERRSAAARGGVESGKSRSKPLENIETIEASASTSVRSKNEVDKIVDKILPSLRSGNTRAQDFRFDEFWKIYPNKVGKEAAKTAFSKALKKVSIEEMMLGLDRYVHKSDDRQWCNPATWLNQARWDDQPATVCDKKSDSTLKALDRMIDDEYRSSDIFDALKTIDHEANGASPPATVVRLPSYSQRY